MGVIESVRSYDLNIPAGGAQNIDAMGDRVQFLSAVDPFAQIELRPNYTQGNIVLMPGQGFRFSQPASGWVVFNKGTIALTGTLLVGNGDFFDQRISGTVAVVDGGKARTLGGSAFVTGANQTPVVGQYSYVMVWNPAGTNKNVMIERIEIACDTAGFIGIGWTTAALATLASAGISKLAGGAVAAASVYKQASAAFSNPNQYGSVQVQANATYQKNLAEPIVLKPGYGLQIVSGGGNVNLTGMFEWYEETAS